MEFRHLASNEISEVYQKRMTTDFPPDELKPLRMILNALELGRYACTGLFDGSRLLAYGFFVILRRREQTDMLLDYFAVEAKHRGQGIGHAFLHQLPEQFPETNTIVIEAENPQFAETKEQAQIQERRIRFYQQNGCVLSGIAAEVFGVPYCVFQLPLRILRSDAELSTLYADIYRQILPPEKFRKHIAISCETAQESLKS